MTVKTKKKKIEAARRTAADANDDDHHHDGNGDARARVYARVNDRSLSLSLAICGEREI